MAPADSNLQSDAHPGTPLVAGLLMEFRRTAKLRRQTAQFA